MLLRRHLFQVLAATLVVACSDDDASPTPPAPLRATSAAADSDRVFPQGVASGDPTPSGVILWTRVDPATQNGATSFDVSFVVATDEALSTIVAQGTVSAVADADHTVRLELAELKADTRYYYRFESGGVTTQVGRTRTAPAADSDRPVTFALASCQDFVGRYYHPWQALLDEKADVDFVLFLGDYVYETTGDPRFQSPTADRKVTLPQGLLLDQASGNRAALSVDDYRSLYRTYRSDAALREVHRLFPFVLIWDDHEFANDGWQDRANDFDGAKGDEASTERRVAASRAWYEYQPAAVKRDASKAFPDDLTIYRTLRYGKHVELFLTDQRLYRADHLIPEGPADESVAKFSTNSLLGSRNFVLKQGFDPKEAAARPTMLGAAQKQWFLDAVKASTSTWKVWGNEVQLWQMTIDLSTIENLPADYKGLFYYTCDQWDGYRSERAEILTALAGVENLVACTGDIHGFFASELRTNFDDQSSPSVGVEYVVAGISSQSLRLITEAAIDGNPVLKSLGLLDLLPTLDDRFLSSNPHLRHSDVAANGIALATASAASFSVTMLRTGDPLVAADSGVKSRVTLTTAAGSRTIVKG